MFSLAQLLSQCCSVNLPHFFLLNNCCMLFPPRGQPQLSDRTADTPPTQSMALQRHLGAMQTAFLGRDLPLLTPIQTLTPCSGSLFYLGFAPIWVALHPKRVPAALPLTVQQQSSRDINPSFLLFNNPRFWPCICTGLRDTRISLCFRCIPFQEVNCEHCYSMALLMLNGTKVN